MPKPAHQVGQLGCSFCGLTAPTPQLAWLQGHPRCALHCSVAICTLSLHLLLAAAQGLRTVALLQPAAIPVIKSAPAGGHQLCLASCMRFAPILQHLQVAVPHQASACLTSCMPMHPYFMPPNHCVPWACVQRHSPSTPKQSVQWPQGRMHCVPSPGRAQAHCPAHLHTAGSLAHHWVCLKPTDFSPLPCRCPQRSSLLHSLCQRGTQHCSCGPASACGGPSPSASAAASSQSAGLPHAPADPAGGH